MNQQYNWNTLYPVNQTTLPPLTVKLVFDEHTASRGVASNHFSDITQGEVVVLFIP